MAKGRPGLFLDLDGTLADSLGVMRGIYDRFLAGYDRTGSPEEFSRLNGPSLSDVLAVLKRDHNLAPSAADLLRTYKVYLREAYDHVHPNKGARELVQAAVDRGWTVCVVSSNVRDTIASWIESVGLADRISVIATVDTVARGKPAPDLYIQALHDSGCDAAVSYAVEDTPAGACSAVGAGLSTFALVAEDAPGLEWPDGVRTIECLDQLVPLLRKANSRGTAHV